MNETIALWKVAVEILVIKDENARHGKAIVMTTFVRDFPVFSGNILALVKKKPIKIIMTLLQTAVHNPLDERADITLSPIDELKKYILVFLQ